MKMHARLIQIGLTALFLVPASPDPGWSAPAISCHCFRDRSFDPGRPAAVDPYLLANAQNSLLAATFGLSKKQIVKDKMAGADGDRLWVVHAFARAAGMPPDQVAAARNRTDSWRSLAEQTDRGGLSPPDLAAIFRRDASEREMASAVVDRVLEQDLGFGATAVAELRSQEADNQEAILAAVLGRIGGVSPTDLLIQIRSGKVTWGQAADRCGVVPATLEERVRDLAATSRPR